MTKLTPSRTLLWTILSRGWRILIGIAAPIVFMPLLFDYEDKINLCAYVLAVMVVYWMFEPINLYITALMPVALFPLLGITTTDKVSMNYMKSTNMMFVGGLIMGIALEHCNLHRRIALKVVILFGSSIRNLMAGIMLVTMFLSMWINNTATTAMMIPIVDSILTEIYSRNDSKSSKQNYEDIEMTNEKDSENNAVISVDIESDHHSGSKLVRKALLLSIAYSANIGGTATLTGTGTNLVLQEVFYSKFPQSTVLTFSSWFLYAFPSALITIFAAWLVLYLFFVHHHEEPAETGKLIRESARKKYALLGNLTFHEIGVLIHFVILILLWFFREPEVYPGWADLLTSNKSQIKDATPAILIALSMFLIPANLHQFYKKESPKEIKRLLNWNVVQTNMSWGVIILLGGGFALAFGTEESKLTEWFSKQLAKLSLQPTVTMLLVMLMSTSITEMASNVATANVILPVLSQLAVHMHVNPLLFMIPVTIGISFAFMLPVSTPPNAIVFEYLGITISEMVKPGLLMNIVAITLQFIFINTLGKLVFSLNNFPDWAMGSNTNLTTTSTHSPPAYYQMLS